MDKKTYYLLELLLGRKLYNLIFKLILYEAMKDLYFVCTYTVHLSRPFNPSIHFPRIFNSQNNQHMAESDIRVGDPVLS